MINKSKWVTEVIIDVTKALPDFVMGKFKKILNSNQDDETKRRVMSELLFFRYLMLKNFKYIENEYQSERCNYPIDWLLEKNEKQFAFEVYHIHMQIRKDEYDKNLQVYDKGTTSVYFSRPLEEEIMKKIGRKAYAKRTDKPLVLCIETDFISVDIDEILWGATKIFIKNKHLIALLIKDGSNYIWCLNNINSWTKDDDKVLVDLV